MILRKQKKVLFLMLICAVFIFTATIVTQALASPYTQNTNKDNSASTSGWIKKGNYYYYYKNGKMLHDTIAKIGAYTFAFDKKGRSVRSKTIKKPMRSHTTRAYHFNKNGHLSFYDVYSKSTAEIYRYKPGSKDDDYMYAYMDVMLKENYSPGKSKNAYCWLSSSIELPKERYTFSLTKKSDCSRKGKPFPVAKLKKGMKLRIFWKGYVNDSYPMDIPYVLKVKVLS